MKHAQVILAILTALAVWALVLPSCADPGSVSLYDCDHPVLGHKNSLGLLDECCTDKHSPCPIVDAGAPPRCDGECMPVVTEAHWEQTRVLVWYGPTDQLPPGCPDNAPVIAWFWSDPISLDTCPLCTCGDPACVLPAGMIGSSDTLDCQGAVTIPFASKPSGTCSTNNNMPIAPNGAKSLSLLAPTLSPCTPQMAIPKDVHPGWAKTALVCTGQSNGPCPGADEVCGPRVPDAPPGFMQCIANKTTGNDSPCPPQYPNRIMVYEDVDFDLACTPCECDSPVGSDCTASVSAFTDPSCVAGTDFSTHTVPLGPPQCVTVPANYSVSGMTDHWITNNPGKCAPLGGQQTGNLQGKQSTGHEYCCRSSDGGA